MRNCHTVVKYHYGSEFSRKSNQTVALFEKIAAPFEKIAPPFFRKVPLNFTKQVVLLRMVAVMFICSTVMRSNSYAFIQDGVCAFLNDESCSETHSESI